ncbi:MAG: GTPase Era [Flavobacteriales bacterium]|nr:GTPase Era [Flavobacteriales bacterium]
MTHKAGYVNIIGEPNVGKSTLLNALLGERLVIVNPKAQTTRHRILGILNGDDHQLILSDTPGILDPKYRMQERMMHAVDEALTDADILIVLVEWAQRPERSANVVDRVQRFQGPVVVLVNKVDTATDDDALASLEAWQAAFPQAKVVPISALHGLNVDELRRYLIDHLPEHPPYFDKEDLSDRNMRFFVSELVREKVLDLYKQEIPYSTQVTVNSFEESEDITRIQADVIVMRESQKGILIGQGGKALRRLGTEARLAIERFLGTKVFLDLRVKVDPDWREDEKKLKRYGY